MELMHRMNEHGQRSCGSAGGLEASDREFLEEIMACSLIALFKGCEAALRRQHSVGYPCRECAETLGDE